MMNRYNPQKKKFSVILFFFSFLTGLVAQGQNNSLYLFEESHSPTQTEFLEHIRRPENEMRNHFLDNPALLHRMVNDERYFFIHRPGQKTVANNQIFAAVENSRGEHTGDYLPYQGKKYRDLSFLAHGYNQNPNATFFGKISFVTGKHYHFDWNTLRYADLYWPYIVADSTGGNSGYEKYNVVCAYSFKVKKVDLGVSGEYKGDFAYRQNDPRIENITTWLILKAGAAYEYGGNLFSAHIEYTLHRQHMDLHHFRTGQFAGFFIEYGFGMFDYIFSPIFRSMKQQQHIKNYGVDLAFNSNPEKALRMNAKLKYNYDRMTTEENNYKLNLYSAGTHQLNFNYGALWNNSAWGLGLFADLQTATKSGKENLFERYVSAEVDGVNVYDYKKIGDQNRYSLNTANAKADIKLSYFLWKNYTLSFLGGVNYFMRDEKYKEYDYQIKNGLVTPSAGVEVCYNSRSFDLLFKGNWGHRSSVDHKYKVDVNMERHTEFQHAFTPYAYYANNSDILTFEAAASKHFSFGEIGIQAQLLYVKGKRLPDVYYDQDRYRTSTPRMSRTTISLSPDNHNATWAKIALFAIF